MDLDVGCGCMHKSLCTRLSEPSLGKRLATAEPNQDIIPRANQHPKGNAAREASEQLLRAPKVPKWKQNYNSKFEIDIGKIAFVRGVFVCVFCDGNYKCVDE